MVSHEASLTGAPRVAREVIRALQSHGYKTEVVHRWGGPLEQELNIAADRHRFEPFRRLRVVLRRLRSTRRLALALESFAAGVVLRRVRPRLVWCNTSLAASYVRPAQRLGIPVILHVHETPDYSASALERYGFAGVGRQELKGVHLVGCSTAVRRELALHVGIEPDEVRVLASPVDVTTIRRSVPAATRNGPLVVVACGTADHRKGVDTFVALAEEFETSGLSNFRFRWIGKVEPSSVPSTNSLLEFIGEVTDAAARIAECDIFLSTARLDPFPLVVLEAMALSKPVIAFSIGGIPDQLGDTGILVTPEDRGAMREAILAIAMDRCRRVDMGRRALARVVELWDIAPFRVHVGLLANDAMRDFERKAPYLRDRQHAKWWQSTRS